MNEASRWRLEMARKIAPAYTASPKVQAVIVGGSVARGCADQYSDVEMGIFWGELPTAEALRAAMERSRGTAWELDPFDPAAEDVRYEEYVVDGLKIDLRHMSVARMGEVLAAVVDGGDLSGERQQIIAAAQEGVALHGASLIENWQARAARYPDDLACAMVRKYASFPPWWAVPMLAERGDLPLVYGAFKKATERIFGMLLGLNRIYDPGLKWLDRTLAAMPVAPTDLAARLKQAFRSEPREGARQMQQLIEETFALVEQQMPEVEIEEARQAFHFRRPIMHAPPPGWL